MPRTFFAAAMLAMAGAIQLEEIQGTKIVYRPDVDID
jgi:hypothetical protein